MIRGGFLNPETRRDLITLVRDGKAEMRLGRRANVLLLLDDGLSCEAVAKVLYPDDDTIRYFATPDRPVPFGFRFSPRIETAYPDHRHQGPLDQMRFGSMSIRHRLP